LKIIIEIFKQKDKENNNKRAKEQDGEKEIEEKIDSNKLKKIT
jgi:hypothetical protein